MPVPKSSRAKIGHAVSKLLAAASKVAVIKNSHARSAKDLQRRNVISKLSGQALQPISFCYTETVPLKSSIFKKAGPGTRKGPLVPRAIPFRVIPIGPWILSEQQNSSAYDSKRKGKTLHFNPPIRKTSGRPVIRATTSNCIRRSVPLSESRSVACDALSGREAVRSQVDGKRATRGCAPLAAGYRY